MDKVIKEFASKYAAKKLGQHFLVDEKVLNDIVFASGLNKKDTVLEVGPGVGVLTKELSTRSKEVIAVEKDDRLVPFLQELFSKSNVKIFKEDILKFNVEDSIKGDYKLIANIPYYLTSKLIRTFLERKNKPTEMILMIQKEVAERIMAKPPRSNILATSVDFYADSEIVREVSCKSFYPKPKVESAVIRIFNIKKKDNVDERRFFRLVKIGFSSPRKKLLNNLAAGFKFEKQWVLEILEKADVDKDARAENLEIADWVRLLSIVGNNNE